MIAVPAAIFGEVSTLPAAVGVLAVIATPAPALPPSACFHLLLEDVQDPGNVGTMLRTAAAAGVEQVLLSKHCAFAWSPKVLRAGQGAHFLTTIVEDVDLVAWARAFRAPADAWWPRSRTAAPTSTRRRLPSRVAIAIGNEGAGLSAALLNEADARVTIPMPGGAESLNAAAAAAVVLFECVRQRRTGRAVAQFRTAEKRASSRQLPPDGRGKLPFDALRGVLDIEDRRRGVESVRAHVGRRTECCRAGRSARRCRSACTSRQDRR